MSLAAVSPLFLFSLLFQVVNSQILVNDTTPTAYLVYFSDESCTSFAGLKGIVSNDPFNALQALVDTDGNEISCVDGMACLFQPTGRGCEVLGSPGEISTAEFDVRDDGIYECDDSNVDIGQPTCALIEPTTCIQSSAYNCHFRLVSGTYLKENPTDIIPPSTNVSEALGQYAYLAYYNDIDCIDLAGIQGFVSDNPYVLPSVGEDQVLTCEESMPCFLQPDGLACEEIELTGKPASGVIQVDSVEVYECDSSNENVDEPICDIIDPQDCRTSSIYSCNFHWMSAILFAEDPASLLAPELADTDTDTTTPPDPQITDAPTPSGTSAAIDRVFSLERITILAVLFTSMALL